MGKYKVLVTMKDIQRYKVLQEVIEKKLKGMEAAAILKLTPVHISRLKTRLLRQGFEGILRKSPASPQNKKITGEIIKEILRLRKDFYYDFNILHFKDKLEENHNFYLCFPHSTSKCNELRSDFNWCFKPKTLSWTAIDYPFYLSNLLISYSTEISSLWQVSSYKSINLLIASSLP
jgi:hypothetical protein